MNEWMDKYVIFKEEHIIEAQIASTWNYKFLRFLIFFKYENIIVLGDG